MRWIVPSIALGIFAAGVGAGEWENLNPGAGGRIIAITLDPQIDGRVFYLSDMEGVYRTENHGESWHYIGQDQRYSNSLFLAVEPRNSNRVYLGTTGGLHISDNGGDNWRFVRGTDGDAIGAIGVNPVDPSVVYAAPGARGRYRELARAGVQVDGPRDLYLSRDRGETWQRVVYERESGLRECYSIQFDATNSGVVYLGSNAGLYRSFDAGASWQKLPAPEGTGAGWGCALSPDGRVLYAAWQSATDERPPHSHIYATSVGRLDWQKLDGQGWDAGNAGGLYWLNGPVVDPRSTPSAHKLLTANLTNLQGLYELTARWEGDRLAGHSWQRILYYELDPRRPDLAPGFDHGWERYGCKPRTWQYAPLTWGRREIWSSLGQKLFAVNSELPGFTDRWEPKYTRFVGEVRTGEGAVRMYTSRGVQCTYNTDMAAHGNYVITCQADNGIVESWDHGASWSIERRPNLWHSNASAACALLDGVDPPLVVAHDCRGFGASGKNGSLQVKALRTHSPTDRFVRIAGGEDERAAMPFAQYRSIATDPRDVNRVYAAAFRMGERWDSGRAAGVWLLSDVPAMLAAAEKPGQYDGPIGERITAGTEADEASFNTLFVDPLDSTVLWGTSDWTGRRGLWKAVNRGGRWDWRFVMGRGAGASPDLAVWERAGRTCIAVCWSPEEGAQHVLTLSTDGGKTWRTVLEIEDVTGLRPPKWLLPDEPLPHFTLMGPAGGGDRIYVTCFSFRHRKPLGLFRGIIRADGSVMWDDFTDGLDFPVANRMKIIENAAARWLYVATRGTGCWRRRLAGIEDRPPETEAAAQSEPEPAVEQEAQPVTAAVDPEPTPFPPGGLLAGAELWCKTTGGPAYGQTFTAPSRAVMLQDGILTVDLGGIGPLQIATLRLAMPQMEAGGHYVFSCEVSAERPGGVIITLPEPHPDGSTDSAGRPMSRPVWQGVRPQWRPVSETFTFTPGVSSETVTVFFDAQNAGAVVRIRSASIDARD